MSKVDLLGVLNVNVLGVVVAVFIVLTFPNKLVG